MPIGCLCSVTCPAGASMSTEPFEVHDDLRHELPARDHRRQLALMTLRGSGQELLEAVVESCLRRHVSGPLIRFAFVATFGSDTTSHGVWRVIGFDSTYNETRLWIRGPEPEKYYRLLFIANVPLDTLRLAVLNSSSSAFLYAGPETSGRVTFIVDDHLSDVGPVLPPVIARAVPALIAPARLRGIEYLADTVLGRRAQALVLSQVCEELGTVRLSLSEACQRARNSFLRDEERKRQ